MRDLMCSRAGAGGVTVSFHWLAEPQTHEEEALQGFARPLLARWSLDSSSSSHYHSMKRAQAFLH